MPNFGYNEQITTMISGGGVAGGVGGGTTGAMLQFVVASGTVGTDATNSTAQYFDVSTIATNGTATFTTLINGFTSMPTSFNGGSVTADTFRRDVKVYVNGQLQTFDSISDTIPATYDYTRGSTTTTQIRFGFQLVATDVVTIMA